MAGNYGRDVAVERSDTERSVVITPLRRVDVDPDVKRGFRKTPDAGGGELSERQNAVAACLLSRRPLITILDGGLSRFPTAPYHDSRRAALPCGLRDVYSLSAHTPQSYLGFGTRR